MFIKLGKLRYITINFGRSNSHKYVILKVQESGIFYNLCITEYDFNRLIYRAKGNSEDIPVLSLFNKLYNWLFNKSEVFGLRSIKNRKLIGEQEADYYFYCLSSDSIQLLMTKREFLSFVDLYAKHQDHIIKLL
jgi:hypothetical protein